MEDIYRFDEAYRATGPRLLAGIDEAGRGPVAGPVVASAVILPQDLRLEGLWDSKKVTERMRNKIFFELVCSASHIGVGIADVLEIETYNILGATKRAMAYAIEDLGTAPDMLLLDAVSLPAVKIRQDSPIKGDMKSASIAAASIVAKVVRDSIMMRYHEAYPQYGFDKHKGYGTAAHLEMIRKHGPCPIHRRGFQGVMEMALHLEF